MKHTIRIASTMVAMGSIVLTQPVFAAGSGYSSPSPSPSNIPGGYTTVLVSKTISTSATTISTAAAGSTASFAFPTGTFSSPTTISVTKPNLNGITSGLPNMHLSNARAIAGFGISFKNSVGSAVTPLAPIKATIHNSAIKPGDILVQITGPTAATKVPAAFSSGQVSFQFQKDPNFAVIAPSTVVKGATNPTTGIPADMWASTGILLAGAGIWSLRRTKIPK